MTLSCEKTGANVFDADHCIWYRCDRFIIGQEEDVHVFRVNKFSASSELPLDGTHAVVREIEGNWPEALTLTWLAEDDNVITFEKPVGPNALVLALKARVFPGSTWVEAAAQRAAMTRGRENIYE